MTLIWRHVQKVGSMFANLDLRYCCHVVRWLGYCCNLSFHVKLTWITFLPIMHFVVLKHHKLKRKHSNFFSIQTTDNFNPITSSSALKGTIYALYICRSSFASRNCDECDSHILATGYKLICPFFIVYWMTVSYHWHANVLQNFISLTILFSISHLHAAVLY